MKIETLMVSGFEPAFKGMRNPMNSWDRSDSVLHRDMVLLIGENDMRLAQNLIKGGSEHCKFLRQIQVWADVDMPRYWWSEMDTYKFGTKNSCSTMHKLLDEKHVITKDDFEYCAEDSFIMDDIIIRLNRIREEYLQAKAMKESKVMARCLVRAKRLLPEGYLQLRTWNTTYQELRNIYHQRKHHRLHEEWVDQFCTWIESLPYANELIIFEK